MLISLLRVVVLCQGAAVSPHSSFYLIATATPHFKGIASLSPLCRAQVYTVLDMWLDLLPLEPPVYDRQVTVKTESKIHMHRMYWFTRKLCNEQASTFSIVSENTVDKWVRAEVPSHGWVLLTHQEDVKELVTTKADCGVASRPLRPPVSWPKSGTWTHKMTTVTAN